MQKKELKKKLCKIDNEEDPLFTIKLRDIVIDCSSEDITQEFFSILDNNNNSIKLRFAAFYAIYIYYRRYEHHSLLFSLVDKYSNIFNEFQLNDVVLSQYYRLKFLETNDEFAIINAINVGRTNIGKYFFNDLLFMIISLLTCFLKKIVSKVNHTLSPLIAALFIYFHTAGAV